MRIVPLLIAASALSGCYASINPGPPPMRSAQAEAELQGLLAGKVPGRPISCLPSYLANNQITIDDHTIAFRSGSRVWVNNLSEGCSNIGGHYALLTRNPTGSLCSGQIAELVDTATGAHVGGCVFGDFIPYTGGR